MRVWIDQDACVGNGICAELAEDMFAFDGELAYVRDGGHVLTKKRAVATVPSALEAAVLDAVDECPAGCIYIESD